MEEKYENENENENNLARTLSFIIKILLIVLSILLSYQLINKISKNFVKNKEINIRNITYIEQNKTQKINNDIFQNPISIDSNNKSVVHKEYIENKTEFRNLINYEHVYFNSFDIFKAARYKYFNILNLNYSFSSKFNLVKLEYIIGLYDKNYTLLNPSEMTLFNNIHFACFLELPNKKIVNSLANIYLDKYIKCVEYFKYGENIKFGLTIYRRISFFKIYFFSENIINYEDITHENDDMFNTKIITSNFNALVSEIKTNKLNKPYSLKKAYLRRPIYDLRRNYVRNNSNWLFRNFYNEYYCYCIGNNCFKEGDMQTCKFLYYIVIIDNERDLYPKTDYIFVDFIFKSLSSDDTYPVFEEMIRQNYSAHYITEKEELMKKYCKNTYHCQTIIPINLNSYFNYGDFFEKYLSLVLKTKAFISCKERYFHRVGYLFYRIEYVTYIAVGHGVCYFKDYLFDKNRIYGINRNNKIIIPPSKVLVSTAVNHGWKEENIIQLNLPRWDRYNHPIGLDQITDIFSGNITENSILVMFTWRMNRKILNNEVSHYYTDNLIKLLRNNKLRKEIKANNITLYVSFHRYIKDILQDSIKGILGYNRNIKVIDQNDISECLAKTNLVVSDFSSIIFDLMYRKKPFIIYVPDSKDPNITRLYTNDYIQLIQRMNNGTFKVQNKCNSVEETVQKIIYYIKNKFKIDKKLQKYYDYFDFKPGNNIDKLINYLLSLK